MLCQKCQTLFETAMDDVTWDCTLREGFSVIQPEAPGYGNSFDAVVEVSGTLKEEDNPLLLTWSFYVSKEREEAVLCKMASGSVEITNENELENYFALLCQNAAEKSYSNSYGISDSTDASSYLITPGEYRCYYFDGGADVFDNDDFETIDTILLSVYADNTAAMYRDLYWEAGAEDIEHEENTFYLTYDEDAFYLDGELFCKNIPSRPFSCNNLRISTPDFLLSIPQIISASAGSRV